MAPININSTNWTKGGVNSTGFTKTTVSSVNWTKTGVNSTSYETGKFFSDFYLLLTISDGSGLLLTNGVDLLGLTE